VRATKGRKPRRSRANQRPRSNRVRHSAAARRSKPSPWAISKSAIVLGVICIMAGVPLITARQSPSPSDSDVASVDAAPEFTAEPEEESIPAPLPARRATKKTAGAEPAPESVKPLMLEPTVDAPVAEAATPGETTVESTAIAAVADVAPVTITGCLELDEHTFRLKDTSGVDAPKSRSWRSGFLRKRPVSIALVDETNTLRLSEHVGHRVAATGVLMNREMRARSMQRVAAACN
jgi:hypothetical protein